MAEDRPLLNEILDYAVFAPIGLALAVVEDLPAFVARGRQQVEGQLGVARFVGKIAFRQLRNQVDAFLDTPERPKASPDVTTTPPTSSHDSYVAADAPSSEGLAIAGYDSLAASQIVARLATLAPDELEAIRAYENATRRRQTILARIAQLGVSDD
jgi:hypothetical protein